VLAGRGFGPGTFSSAHAARAVQPSPAAEGLTSGHALELAQAVRSRQGEQVASPFLARSFQGLQLVRTTCASPCVPLRSEWLCGF
jgi:hypothetical protein